MASGCWIGGILKLCSNCLQVDDVDDAFTPRKNPWQFFSNKFFKLHVAGVDLQNLLRLTLQRFGLKTNHRIQSAKEQQAAWTPGRVWLRNLT